MVKPDPQLSAFRAGIALALNYLRGRRDSEAVREILATYEGREAELVDALLDLLTIFSHELPVDSRNVDAWLVGRSATALYLEQAVEER